MVKRNVHYEAAFEDYLRENQIPYVAINEAKRPIVAGRKIKNFDFIVYSRKKKNLLVEIKGKYFPYVGREGGKTYWENWVKKEDMEGLEFWQEKFGENFKSVFVYCYYIRNPSDRSRFSIIHTFKGISYGFVGVALEDYKQNSKSRSPKFDNAFYVSRKTFPRLIRPVIDFL